MARDTRSLLKSNQLVGRAAKAPCSFMRSSHSYGYAFSPKPCPATLAARRIAHYLWDTTLAVGMNSRDSENRYDERNIDTLERVYGEGYLSAGGDDEVARIVSDVGVRDQRVLDVGCGLGGAAVALVRDHGADHVQGVDVDAAVLARARALVNRRGVADKISLLRTEVGPLPFDDASFGIVYATAVTCHIQELDSFFRDIRRVLSPGGILVGNEWFKAADNPAFSTWDDLLRGRGLNFYFVTRETFVAALRTAGFQSPAIVDRTQAFTRLAQRALWRVDNELRQELLSSTGDEGYRAFRDWTSVRHRALSDGGMYQGHFRAENRDNIRGGRPDN